MLAIRIPAPRVLWTIVSLAAVSAPGATTHAAEPVFAYPIETTTLDNGLKIVTVRFPSPGVLSYYTIVRTGSRNEVEPGLSGFAHFFEHMMFRGTPRYSSEQYNDALKQLGADSNAFTTDDWTAYHTTASADALATIIELEADRFQNLSYDVAAFQKEARAVLGEYNKIASSPFLLLDETLQDTAYDKHTYKHTTIGFLKDIVDMPNQFDYSRKFFERWYRPDNCIVLVVGDVRHNEVVELARRNYGAWKPGVAEVAIPAEPPQTAERRRGLTWKGVTQPYLYLGFHAPAFDPTSVDVAALDVLSEALFSQVSPLYRKLVLDEARVDSLSAGATFHRDPTLFTIMVRLRDAADLPAIEQEILQALDEAAKTPLAAQRLADIQSHLRYNFATSLDSTSAAARSLGFFLQLTGDPDSLNETYATYEKVTPADVQRVAARFFTPANRTVVTLVSEEDAEALASSDAPAANPPRQPAATASNPTSPPGQSDDASPAPPATTNPRTVPQHPAVAAALAQQSPLVVMKLVFRTGTKDDPPGKEGLAALTARMIAEGGSRKVSYAELLDRMYPLGARMDGQCDKELTIFTAEVHRDKADEFLPLFFDTLAEPRFDQADFDRLRQEQIVSLSTRLRGNDDENLGKWTLQLMLYPAGHPYGHVDQGTLAGLESITLDDVKEFYRRHYTQNNVYEVGIDVRDVASRNLFKRLMAILPRSPGGNPISGSPGPTPAPLPPPAELNGLELLIVEKPTIATAISLGFPLGLTRADDDFYALAVAASALGEHRTFNGRLMKNMRGKRGLNYGDYAYIENFIQDGFGTFALPGTARQQQYFSIWIRPVPHDKAAFALRQAVRELEMFVADGLSEEEFQATRSFLLHYSKLWVQTQSRRLGYQIDGQFYHRRSVVEELAQRLPGMTRENVNAAIRKHLQAKNLAVAIVTDDGARLRDELLSGKPTPLVYDTEGTPEDILAEDRIIESWPLAINRERLRIVPADEMFER